MDLTETSNHETTIILNDSIEPSKPPQVDSSSDVEKIKLISIGEPLFSVSEDRKSMIVIAKCSNDIKQIEEEWRRENDLNGLNCLANAASSLIMSEANEKEINKSQTSTPTKLDVHEPLTSPKNMPKTIRENYEVKLNDIKENKDSNLESNENIKSLMDIKIEPFCASKPTNISCLRKKDFEFSENKKKQRNDQRYFRDFCKNIKSESDDDRDYPDILKYARRTQESARSKLKK